MSKTTFFHVDTAIFQVLWSWATWRHPKKPGRWMATKYFGTRNGRNWTFVGTRVGNGGHPTHLCRAGDVPIKRHVKIKGTANPYDPQWEVYCEERLRVKMPHDLKGYVQDGCKKVPQAISDTNTIGCKTSKVKFRVVSL